MPRKGAGFRVEPTGASVHVGIEVVGDDTLFTAVRAGEAAGVLVGKGRLQGARPSVAGARAMLKVMVGHGSLPGAKCLFDVSSIAKKVRGE